MTCPCTPSPGPMTETLQAAARHIAERLGPWPSVMIVTGSGQSALAQAVADGVGLDYGEIPGFPTAGVVGHDGRLIRGRLGGREVVVFSGRKHLYEGEPLATVTFAVALGALAGVRTLILCNAAGSVTGRIVPGDLAVIGGHLALAPRRAPGQAIGPLRSRPCYSPRLAELARQEALCEGIPLRDAVYCVTLGPTYETPAEVRYARLAGADLVGMSTVPEALEAARQGLETLVLSCVTNSHVQGAGEVTHDEVIAMGRQMQDRLIRLVSAVVAGLPAIESRKEGDRP